MSAVHTPGKQCDECEGFCLVPVVPLQAPVVAVEWSCHAPTTIKDATGKVLAECGGHGRHSVEDVAIAAEIVRRVNARDDLVLALTKLADAVETRRPEHEGYLMLCASEAREAIAKAASSPTLSGWWCANCQTTVPNENVTYEETHDTRAGGCGEPVGEPPSPSTMSSIAKATGASQ